MRTKLPTIALLLLFLVGFTYQNRPAWEYRTYLAPDAKESGDLKTLGEQGWELVAVRPYTEGYTTGKFILYFKRQKP